MVGSPDYFDARISGAVNAAVTLRQPGSAIKPITYAAAFARGALTAATPIYDVRTAFPTREGLPYVPVNYDRRHYGPISARQALATSNNTAAVHVLHKIGMDAMLAQAHALGLASLKDKDRYGLALTLGGGEVRLLELTAAYGAFANGGLRVTPHAVIAVSDRHAPCAITGRPLHPPGTRPGCTGGLADQRHSGRPSGPRAGLRRVQHPAPLAACRCEDRHDDRLPR